MSHNSAEKLVKMANQIGSFFSAQKSTDQAAGVLDHIKKFWDPRMRAGIIDHFAHGGAGLDPIVLEAIKRLAGEAKQAPSEAHQKRAAGG